MHGKNFAKRTHDGAVAEFAVDTVANHNQVVFEDSPRAQAIQVGGQSIKPLPGLERWRRLTRKLFDKALLGRHWGGGSSFPGHDGERYSFVLSLLSFSRMNVSISEALARIRSHCSL
jgi:hypothetical protein